MKTKDRFNLSHVIGFFVGIVVTVIFNWIVFKDPKRITAPGVATLVAMCTFTLALWSAFKVNKWLNSKINETAYKQAEISMELLRNVIIDLFHISHCFKRLRIANVKNGEYERILNDLRPRYEKYIENFNNLLIVTDSLPSWNIIPIHKAIVTQSSKLMHKNNFASIVKSSIALLSSDEIKYDKTVYFMSNSSIIILTVDTVIYRFTGLLTIPYDKKFKHLSHNS